MKVYTGINLAKSFEDLKLMMNKADERANSGEEFGLPYAYGMLKGAIKGHILSCTDTPSEEMFPKREMIDTTAYQWSELEQEIEAEMNAKDPKNDIEGII